MKKRIIFSALEIFAYRLLFPLSRWYKTNLFIYSSKNKWLKERPGISWLILGFPFFLCSKVVNKIKYFYSQAVISNYSILIKKHYNENYAYPKDVLFSKAYKEYVLHQEGSLKKLFQNEFFLKIADIQDGDSFLDCGCGIGMNLKEIASHLPLSKVIGFDISPNAINFAKTNFDNGNIELFIGSVTDRDVLKKFTDKSIDHVLFANMFATIISGSIEETINLRKDILLEAARVAKKNIIINEHCSGPRKIYIEQKFRAIFYDDYSNYFEGMKGQGNVLLFPDALLFLKKCEYL